VKIQYKNNKLTVAKNSNIFVLNKDIYAKALDYISRREYGVEELRTKLSLKFKDEKAVNGIIAILVDRSYLSDERFVKAFIELRSNRGYGPTWIRATLKNKMISTSIIDSILEQMDIDWFALAESVKNKKYGVNNSMSDKDKNKQFIFLKNRGFSMDQILNIYKEN